MKVPEFESAVVPKAKIVDYLLSLTHPEGAGKAAFFRAMGFNPDEWTELANALKKHVSEHEVVSTEASRFGVRYRVDGELFTPSGRRPSVRSVWFIGVNEYAPRLATAHPLRPPTVGLP